MLYAYLTSANYDFSCANTAAPTPPPPSALTPTHHRPTHPDADDRSKNLRPKRNIRTAMNHEIML